MIIWFWINRIKGCWVYEPTYNRGGQHFQSFGSPSTMHFCPVTISSIFSLRSPGAEVIKIQWCNQFQSTGTSTYKKNGGRRISPWPSPSRLVRRGHLASSHLDAFAAQALHPVHDLAPVLLVTWSHGLQIARLHLEDQRATNGTNNQRYPTIKDEGEWLLFNQRLWLMILWLMLKIS